MKTNGSLHGLAARQPAAPASSRAAAKTLLVLLWSLAASLLVAPKAGATNWDISITAYGFEPSYLEVSAGDTVTWWNDDYDFFDYHSTHCINYSWNSGPIQVGYGVYLTVTRIGTWNYRDDYGYAGSGILVVKPAGPPPPPGNDQCSGAYPLAENSTYGQDTTYATSTGDPAIACGASGKGVWFTYTPSVNGRVTLSTCGGSFDTVLAVYTGSCGALTPVVCGDDNGPGCTGSAASVAFQGVAYTTYTILAAGKSGASGSLNIQGTTVPPAAWQEAQLNYDLGPSIVQPNANQVLLVDSTNDRLLAFNTDTGAFVSAVRLYGKVSSLGLMCFSVDGQTLYVPLGNTNKLQVISTATLTTSDLVPLSVSPNSLAAGADGYLYAMVGGQLTKLDPVSGQTLGSVGNSYSYYSPILKANASGTRLYIMETGLSGAGPAVDEYAVVTAGLPTYVTNHFSTEANDTDLVIAEDIGWLYMAAGGVYGVGAWDMNTRTYSYWPFGSAYGVAVSMIPGDSAIYGASGDPYNPLIVSFDRTTGTVLNTFTINASGRGTGAVTARSLKVTPNGRIFYARSGRKLGLIGSSILVTNTPTAAEVVDAGTNRTVWNGESFTLNAVAPAASGADTFTWTQLAGPGTVNFSTPNALSTTAQISTTGNYTLQIERDNSAGWVSTDLVYITVNPRPITLDQAGLNGGHFQVRLNADPGNYQVLVSSNLVNWVVLTNVANPTGQIGITDYGTGFSRRFYKAKAN